MPAFVIAECGVCHNGSVDLARHMISVAKECGADAVKFQLFNADLLGRPEIKHLELTEDQMTDLYGRCNAQEIEFMCTPFDVQSVKFLAPLVKRMKIASGCLEHWDLLEAVKDTNLPVILSTGMSDVMRIEKALQALGHGIPALHQQEITLLHCTSTYPCPIEDVNLKAMEVLNWQWGKHPQHSGVPGRICNIGYSDHTEGILVPVAAVAMGATVLEKHLTMNRHAQGPDHRSSIEPSAFKEMVRRIRITERAMGDGIKRPMESEQPVMKIWNR